MPLWADRLHVKGLYKTEVFTDERTPNRWKRLFCKSRTNIQYVLFMLHLIAAMVDRVAPGHFSVIGCQLKKKPQ